MNKRRVYLFAIVVVAFIAFMAMQETGRKTRDVLYFGEDYNQYEEEEEPVGPIPIIGVAMPNKTSERWINDGVNMKAKLEALGYEVDLQYADDDIEKQISQISNMIKNGADCLVIASIDSVPLCDVLAEAYRRGIPVMAYDRLLMDTAAVDYYATFDNLKVGTQIGRYIENKANLQELRSKGGSRTIEFFMGSPDDNNAVYLYKGVMGVLRPYLNDGTLVCKSGLTEFDDTCILRWSGELAYANCNALLNEFYQDEKLDIACSAFDQFSYGIKRSLQEHGYSEYTWPVITGQDAERTSIRAISEGFQSMTVYKDTRVLASKCVQMVEAVMNGKRAITNDINQYYNNVIYVPSYLCDPVVIDVNNYEEILFDGGYYTKEQVMGNRRG